ncbi:FMN reductase [Haloactinopolyspora alba]|uniref:FMN reductase n=1 Tax=Haloactinopolyspora alba TaxID=648780 RepID=A0A2P8EBX6_9ACTN|nr:FMN reductase [Haloactinopolyspora alba]PSL06975.1 FMN reductase [Haloactinopolyspora alba]
MTQRKLAVVSAGLREPSSTRMLADRLAAATAEALRQQDTEPEVTVVELRDHAAELSSTMLTGFATGTLSTAIDDVVAADGLIAVTPVFTASYSGLFKSFFDVLDADALAGMPVLIGATGGTERHSLVLEHAMRPMFTYLRSVVVPTGVYAATSDWGTGTATGVLGDRITRAGAELAGLVASRKPREAADPFAAPTPFEQLLAEVDHSDN